MSSCRRSDWSSYVCSLGCLPRRQALRPFLRGTFHQGVEPMPGPHCSSWARTRRARRARAAKVNRCHHLSEARDFMGNRRHSSRTRLFCTCTKSRRAVGRDHVSRDRSHIGGQVHQRNRCISEIESFRQPFLRLRILSKPSWEVYLPGCAFGHELLHLLCDR